MTKKKMTKKSLMLIFILTFMLAATSIVSAHDYSFKIKFSTKKDTVFTLKKGKAKISGNSKAWYIYDEDADDVNATYKIEIKKNSTFGKTIFSKTFDADEEISKSFKVPKDGEYYMKVTVVHTKYPRKTYVQGSGTITQK